MAASLGAVEAHLECPAVKLIMSSFRWASENTSSPPGTMKLHMASPILRVWQVCVSGTTNFETPNVSILLKEGKAALAGPVRMGEPEVRFVFLCGEERNSQAPHTRAFRWQPPVVKCCLRGLPEPASPLTITTRPWRWLRLIGWHTDWARGAWKSVPTGWLLSLVTPTPPSNISARSGQWRPAVPLPVTYQRARWL